MIKLKKPPWRAVIIFNYALFHNQLAGHFAVAFAADPRTIKSEIAGFGRSEFHFGGFSGRQHLVNIEFRNHKTVRHIKRLDIQHYFVAFFHFDWHLRRSRYLNYYFLNPPLLEYHSYLN